MIIGVFAIISGISGHGVLFNIAVSGPLIWFSIGIFIMFFVIESRHAVSQNMDSKLTKIQGLETRNKEVSLKLELVMFLSSVILLIGGIYFLSFRLHSAFVMCLSFSCVILATVIGRKYGSSVGESEKSDSFDDLDTSSKSNEYKQLKDWLKGDLNEILSVAQEEKINLQKDIFVRKIKSELSNHNKLKATITTLNKSKNLNDLVKILFSHTMKNSYNGWLIGAIEHSKKPEERTVRKALVALLLLPSVIEIMAHISAPKSGDNTKLLNRLLTVSAQFAKLLHSFDLLLDGGKHIPNSTGVKDKDIDLNLQKFIKFLSLKASMHEDYEFTPWWLINIRSIMVSINDFDSWNDEDSLPKNFPNYSTQISKEPENWCFLLSEFFDGTEYVDKSYEISHLFESIFELQTGDYTTDLLKLTWSSYQNL